MTVTLTLTLFTCSGRPLDGRRKSSCAAVGTKTVRGNMRMNFENSVIRSENALRMRHVTG